MKRIAFLIGVLVSKTVAYGGFIGTVVDLAPEQHPDPGVVTVRVYLLFDGELHQVLAVSGDADICALHFQTDGADLRQNCEEGPATGCVCDFLSLNDLGGDSWVNLGDEIGDQGGDLCEEPPGVCCIAGNEWGIEDNGGYFDPNPGTPLLPDENGRVLIAQFSLPDGTYFNYQGTVNYLVNGGDLTGQCFGAEHTMCLGDLDLSGSVDFNDLLQVLASWGNAGGPEDLDGSGIVDFGDLLIVLAAWGPR